MFPALRTLGCLLIFSGTLLADNWPAWRGPAGNGFTPEKNLPMKWSATENIRWKVALPSRGNSTPIVWENKVFITQELDKKGLKRALICFDRKSGLQLWQREVSFDEVEPTHKTNPYCSASPVTDGQRVIASFGSAGLVCYDLDGDLQWKKDLGKMWHIWGNASSPILYENLVILWAGPGEEQFLIALDKKTGEKVWRHDEPGGKFGKTNAEWVGSWSTPIIARIQDHDELILGMPHKLKGFDPKTGAELWSCDGLTRLVYNSPVCSPDGIVVAFSGFGGDALAARAGGKGDVTKTHRLWHQKGNPQRIGSAVILGDHAYLISAPGLGQCFELKTGKDLWEKQRVGGTTWSSALLTADHRIYIANDAGDVHILEASPGKLKELAVNSLGAGEVIQASIAVSNGELFIRSQKHLWCIGR